MNGYFINYVYFLNLEKQFIVSFKQGKNMNTLTPKLILHWLLSFIGLFITWAAGYFFLAWYVISQMARFRNSRKGFWDSVVAADVFWLILALGGTVLVIYLLKWIVRKSPAPNAAVIAFSLMVAAVTCYLVSSLSFSNFSYNVLPHLAINLVIVLGLNILQFSSPATDNTQ